MQFHVFIPRTPLVLFLLLLPISSTSSSSVRYCDGIFQLANRTDESEQICKRFSSHIVEKHVPCNTSTGVGGLTCGGECVGLEEWCVDGTSAPTLCGGYHFQDPSICRNKTFWENHKCPSTSKGRCTGWWPGQCQGEDGCRDQSNNNNNDMNDNNNDNTNDNNNNAQCLSGDKVINGKLLLDIFYHQVENITEEFITCQDKYNSSMRVCAKKCDRVKDGCKDDLDEKDCVPVVSKRTLVLVVVCLITVTIIAAEVTLWAVKAKSSKKELELQLVEVPGVVETNGESSTEMKNLLKENGAEKRAKIKRTVWHLTPWGCLEENQDLKDIASHLDKLFSVILDPSNWEFGRLKLASCSPFAIVPSWTTKPGQLEEDVGFKKDKMDTLKILYYNFRKMINDCEAFTVRKCDCVRCMCFRFFLFAVPNKYPENPRRQFEKLPHYVFDLLYNKLEVEFLKEHVSHTEDIDVSIKYALGNRESPAFYGNVVPYLHIPSLLSKIICECGVWIENIERFVDDIPYIKYISYFIGIILAIVGFYVDFIKDVLIADHVSFLYTKFWDFKSQIVILLWLTIFVNQTMIGIMIAIRGPTKLFNYRVHCCWKRYLIRAVFLLMSPLSPTLLLYMNARVGMIIKETEKMLNKELEVFQSGVSEINPPKVYPTTLDNLKMYHEREMLVERKKKMEAVIGTSYIIGIIYENTPQILVQVLIVLLSLTSMTLPDLTGIEAVYDRHNDNDNIGSFFFFFSIIWSLISIITSLTTTFFYRKEYSVPDLGKVLIFFQMFISASLRLICVIFYIAPYLGLFNLLLHYQIEHKFSYSQELLAEMDGNFQPSLALSWYLLMSRKQALIVFFFTPLAHAIMVLIYKSRYVDDFLLEKVTPTSKNETAPDVSSGTSNWLLIVYNRCLHSVSSLLGPTLWRDWDWPIKCSRQDYQQVWRKVQREYLHMSILFFLENLLLLIPLLYTCSKVLQRHADLQYPLPEEEVVVTYCYWFISTPVILLVLSCLHFLLFNLYNKYGHPWSILLNAAQLNEKKQEEGAVKQSETSI